jgi:hypothetical protein
MTTTVMRGEDRAVNDSPRPRPPIAWPPLVEPGHPRQLRLAIPLPFQEAPARGAAPAPAPGTATPEVGTCE